MPTLLNASTTIAPTLQAAYNEQYSEQMTEWRDLSGKEKANNILEVCEGRTFSNVLECGAGEGGILKWLDASHAFGALSAIDVSDSAIEMIKRRDIPSLVDVKKFDGYTIPYADKAFDLVYCSHVIEHVEHPRLLMREIKRVSGFQVFEVPLDYSIGCDQNVAHFLSYGHINVYTPALFKFLLKSEGYTIHRELLSQSGEDVVRYNLYKNQGRRKTALTELKVMARAPLKSLRGRIKGKRWNDEYGYNAFTCLVEATGELKIF